MFTNWSVFGGNGVRSDEDLRKVYGAEAVISRVGQYNLIHLDSPAPEEVERRIAEFDPAELYDDDCPVCRMLRDEPCDVIYDATWDETDEQEN